jgi:5-methylcytosine-specific restriction endonuclease McrA
MGGIEPLKRSPIRRKAGVKHTTAYYERKKERREELARRRKLKAELLAECPTDDQGRRLCPKCLRIPDFRGLQLVHKKPLSTGGETTRENCVIRCAPCHFGFGEPWSHKREGRPKSGQSGLDKGIADPLH